MKKRISMFLALFMVLTFLPSVSVAEAWTDTRMLYAEEPTPESTESPLPEESGSIETPEPTQTPDSTETPEPTESPEITETPEPTESAEPAAEPTETAAAQDSGLFPGKPGKKPDVAALTDETGELSEIEQKLSTRILQLTNRKYLPEGITQGDLIKQMEKQVAKVPVKNGVLGITSGYEVYVYIQLNKGSDFNILAPYVSRIVNQDDDAGIVTAWVDLYSFKALASLDEVRRVREIASPVVNTGSVTSEGDSILKTDLVRAQLGADGTGIKIGIISDGVDHWTDARDSGDLPVDVTVLSNAQGGDEGTAMLEIIYDLAPGAKLYFHDCGSSELDFNDAITALADAGCTVICDDIGWTTEPFFEDGVVAQHVADMLEERGITYVTAAGNSATQHYQGAFYYDYSGWTDFSHGQSDYTDLYAEVKPYETITIVLQWNEPFGAAAWDYNLYLFNASTYSQLTASTDVQNGNDDPIECISYTNNRSYAINVAIAVQDVYMRTSGKTLELYVYDSSMYTNNVVSADSIFGHAAVPGVITCGAIDEADSDTIEYYSSCGPVTMLSGTRQKPDVCGIDGVSVTGAGGFYSDFYGTSAATPHIAAVAALLMSRFPSMTSTQIKQLITSKAVDLGKAGYDSIYGYGRSNALSSASSYLHVDFDSQGGSNVASQLIAKGGKVTKPANPIWEGYYFVNWYKEPECINVWSFDTNTVSSGDVTLYAKWVSNPLTPVGFTASSAGYESINVSWNAVSDANGYELYRATSESGTYSLLKATTSLSYKNTGLSTGKSYYYKVRAYKTVGSSKVYGAYSEIISTAPALSPITSVAAVSSYPTGVKISWNAVSGRTQYEVFRSTKPDGGFTKITSTTYTYYTNTGLTPFVTYYYQIRVYRTVNNQKVYANDPEPITASVRPILNDVSGVKAVMYSVSSIKISWPAVTGTSGYEVLRSATEDGEYSPIATTTKTYYTNTSLIPNVAYYYKVRAYRTVGSYRVYSEHLSDVKSATPVFNNVTNVKAAMYSVTSNKISWSAVSGRTGYEVWWSEQVDGTYALLTSATSNYTDTYIYHKNIDPAKTYYYKVKAYVTVNGTRQYSVESEAVPGYNKVNGAKAAMYSVTSNKISWSAVSGSDAYELYRCDAGGGSAVLLKTTTSTYYVNTGLTTDTTYYYKVRAYDTINYVRVYSGFSDVVSATPIVKTVSSPKAARYTSSKIKLSWSAVSGATGYEIERCTTGNAGDFVLIRTTTTTTAYYYDSGLIKNTRYYYRLRAYRKVGGTIYYGGWSAVVSAKPY